MESCYFPTSYNKDEKCSHLWETVIDVKGNCGKAEKRHQICTVCQERKAPSDIPATGKHKWSKYIVTKKATVFAQGQENGDIRLTAQRSTNRRAVKVKVLVTVDARGRVKGIRTGSTVITVKAGRAVYRTVIKVTK